MCEKCGFSGCRHDEARDKGARLELGAMSRKELEIWIVEATPRQLYQAIDDGQKWLDRFIAETDKDLSLVETVKDHLDMLERAYQLVPESGIEPPQ